MLSNKDLEKIEQYVNKLTAAISADIQKDMLDGMSDKDAIDNAIRRTVNKITPESKVILSSVYNMLMEQTLSSPLYQNPQNEAAFYERNIQKDLTANFSFDVPDHIDYEETRQLINKWTVSGAIVVAEGVVSIALESIAPVMVAVVLVGIMLYLLKDEPVIGNKDQNINSLIAEYLANVKRSLMAWVNEIEKYYDSEVKKLEEELN